MSEMYAATIFRQEEKDQDQEVQEATPGPYFGWWGVYMDIAESGLFGRLEDVHQANFHSICIYLSKKYLEARDRERRRDLDKQLRE